MLDPGHFEDLLIRLERDVLAIDATGDSSIVHLLFRTVHNLKSSSAQAGLAALAGDLHALEDSMDRVRRGRVPWTTACYDQVTGVIDRVRLAIHSGEPETVLEAPREPARPDRPAPAASAWGPGLTQEEEAACALAKAVGLGVYRIEKLFRRGLDQETFLGLPVLEDIRELGKLISIRPSWEVYSQGAEEQVVQFLFASPRSLAELSEVLFDPLIALQEPAPAPPAAARTRERLRLLIIEDDATTGLLMSYILRQHGETVLCETGEAGLAALRDGLELGEPFDLVVLDLFLPDMHGDAILKEIREEEFRRGIHDPREHCVVIINTANSDVDQLMHSLKNEPDGYLIKPINVALLVEKVEALKAERIRA